VSNLKPWSDPDAFPGRDYSQPGPVTVIGDEEYFTIDRFIKNLWVRSGRGYKEQYLVHWKDYPSEEVSWLPVDQLQAEMQSEGFKDLLTTLQTRKSKPVPKQKKKKQATPPPPPSGVKTRGQKKFS